MSSNENIGLHCRAPHVIVANILIITMMALMRLYIEYNTKPSYLFCNTKIHTSTHIHAHITIIMYCCLYYYIICCPLYYIINVLFPFIYRPFNLIVVE